MTEDIKDILTDKEFWTRMLEEGVITDLMAATLGQYMTYRWLKHHGAPKWAAKGLAGISSSLAIANERLKRIEKRGL